MDDYLSKPFQAEQLVGIVKKWVDNKLASYAGSAPGGDADKVISAKSTKE
jgi:hypothetical protein